MSNVVRLTPEPYEAKRVAFSSDEGYGFTVAGTVEGSIDFSIVTAAGNLTYVLTSHDAHQIIAGLHAVCRDVQANCLFDGDPRLYDQETPCRVREVNESMSDGDDMKGYELLEDVPQMVTRVLSQSGRTNATRCEQDGRWYNQTSDLVPLDTFGPWTVVQHSGPACDVCMEVPGALIPSANGDDTRACADCVKVLVLCPRCDLVATWKLSGDLWICGSAEGCGYPGVWLDQIPYEPPPFDCVDCGNPIPPMQAMCAVVEGRAVSPLCPVCYEKRRNP